MIDRNHPHPLTDTPSKIQITQSNMVTTSRLSAPVASASVKKNSPGKSPEANYATGEIPGQFQQPRSSFHLKTHSSAKKTTSPVKLWKSPPHHTHVIPGKNIPGKKYLVYYNPGNNACVEVIPRQK